ncbi:hypothetical protein D3C71_1788190 [compost metagenome]
METALAGGDKTAAFNLINAAKAPPDLQIILVFTGDLAGFAAGTARGVNIEPKLAIADRGILDKFTHALATSTSIVW